MAFEYLLISLALNLLAYALMPKPQVRRPEPVTEIKVPSIQEGKEIPVVFGKMEMSPFVAWYGDLNVVPIVQKGPRKFGIVGPRQNITIGYRYNLGVHFLWCHAPVDGFDEIRVDDRVVYGYDFVKSDRRMSINQPSLFGETEGGVSGEFDFETGAPTQGANDYLVRAIAGQGAAAAAGTTTTTVVGTSDPTYVSGETQWYVDFDQEGVFQSIRIWWDGVQVARLYTFNSVDENTTSYVLDGITYTRGDLQTPLDNDKAYAVSKTLVETVYTPNPQETYDAPVPAFRGLTGFVLRRMYLGNSPYLKKWSTRLQRVFKRRLNGQVVNQWRVSLAGIGERVYENKAILISIDNSGSMLGPPATTVAEALKALIIDLAAKIGVNNTTNDLQIVTWGPAVTHVLTYRNYSVENTQDVLDFIDANVDGRDGGTSFTAGVSTAVDFYNGAGTKERVMIFLSDGLPNEGLSNAVAAAGTLNSISNLQRYAVGINATNLSALELIDNTEIDDVPVVSSGDTETLKSIFYFPFQSNFDMNPAHIIRECLTNDEWGLGYPEEDIDEGSFATAAIKLFNEEFGLSLAWTQQSTIEDFIQIVLNHIDASLYVSRKTGLWTLFLIRDDYLIDTLEVFTDSDVVRVEDFVTTSPAELVNSVTIIYSDRVLRDTASLVVNNLAQIQQLGQVVPTTVNYPGIWRNNLAYRVAVRDLRSLSTPLISGTLRMTRRAVDFTPGYVFRLNMPRYGLTGEVMRVFEVDVGDGTENEVIVKFAQDVFGTGARPLFIAEPGVEFVPVTQPPSPVQHRFVVEENYYSFFERQLLADAQSVLAGDPLAGFVEIGGVAPSSSAFSATLFVNTGAAYEESLEVGLVSGYSLASRLEEFGSNTTAVFSASDDLSTIPVGSLMLINTEFVRVDSYDNTTKQTTLSRGMLDTVPQLHEIGSRAFLYTDASFVEPDQYTSGDTVSVKLLTNTVQGRLALGDAPVDTVTLNSRIARPYPPGNLRVDGNEQHFGWTGILAVTWSHRDRVAQQSKSVFTRYLDGDIGPEAGVTYTVEVYSYDENGTKSGSPVFTDTAASNNSYNLDTSLVAPPAGSIAMSVEVKSTLNSLDCWQVPSVLCVLDIALETISEMYLNINDASTLYVDDALQEAAQFNDETIGSVAKI